MYIRKIIFCLLGLTVLTSLSFSQEVSVFPDMTRLTEVIIQATKAVVDGISSKSPDIQLESIQIKKIEAFRFMLSGDINETTYLVYLVGDTGFWKTQPHILFLLNGSYDLLLLFHGGYNGNGIDFRVVDTNENDGQKEILVNDHASGNQSSQTRTFVLRYDGQSRRFLKVFDAVIKQTGMGGYTSKLDFTHGEGDFKDLVIKTQMILGHEGGNEQVRDVESRFIWDGRRYSGKLIPPMKMEVAYPGDGLISLP